MITIDNNTIEEYIQNAIERFPNSAAEEYILARGISKELTRKFRLGGVSLSPFINQDITDALLIPTSDTSYVARWLDVENEGSNRYMNSPGECHIFNEAVLYSATSPVFITEGAIDALSIMECGGEAIALNSTSLIGKLVAIFKTKPPNNTIIVALDQDKAGIKAADDLSGYLKKMGIQFYTITDWKGCKDANELLIKDKVALISLISDAIKQAQQTVPAMDPKEQELYDMLQKNRMDNCVADMLGVIAENANRPRISTGLQQLDKALEGGLLPGLHLVAAMSSLGKTTLVLQMIANMAKQGQNVILFSLEMSRLDLFAKNISRHMFELDMNYRKTTALSTSSILNGELYRVSDKEVKVQFQNAVEEYNKYAEHLTVIEGACDIGAVQIKEIVDGYIRVMGKKPVVVIDYAQLMYPADIKMSDKQNMDYAIKCLKKLAAQGVAIIAISSLNRQSYDSPVTLSSLKETGSLEYSAETVLALDFEAMYDALRSGNPKSFDLNAEKEKEVRSVLLTVLKCRNGPMGMQIPLAFYPKYNYFAEKYNRA